MTNVRRECATADRDGIDIGFERGGSMDDQRPFIEFGERLVRTETPRLSTGQHRTEQAGHDASAR